MSIAVTLGWGVNVTAKASAAADSQHPVCSLWANTCIHRIRFKSPSVTGKTQPHTDLITEDDTVVNETDKQEGETSRCPVATVKQMTVER